MVVSSSIIKEIESLEKMYKFGDKEKVEQFLFANPHFINYLKKERENLISVLGEDIRPILALAEPLGKFDKLTLVINPSVITKERTSLKHLEAIYEFVDPERITDFLRANPDLIPFLQEAPKHIYRIFGKNVRLFLELHSDPEEEWDELFIVIKSPYSPKKARALMDKLGEEWFLDVLDKVGNRLCITEEPL